MRMGTRKGVGYNIVVPTNHTYSPSSFLPPSGTCFNLAPPYLPSSPTPGPHLAPLSTWPTPCPHLAITPNCPHPYPISALSISPNPSGPIPPSTPPSGHPPPVCHPSSGWDRGIPSMFVSDLCFNLTWVEATWHLPPPSYNNNIFHFVWKNPQNSHEATLFPSIRYSTNYQQFYETFS